VGGGGAQRRGTSLAKHTIYRVYAPRPLILLLLQLLLLLLLLLRP